MKGERSMNTNRLKGKLKEFALSQEETADKMGISLSRFNAKINGRGGAQFVLSEVQILKKLLCLTAEQVDQIFFS